MAKPLLGGSAAMLALLSASLILYAQPSVAESLATASPESQTQDKRVSATATRTDTGGETVTPADSSVKNDTLTPSNRPPADRTAAVCSVCRARIAPASAN